MTPGLIDEILESIGLEKLPTETEGNGIKRDICLEGEQAVKANAKYHEEAVFKKLFLKCSVKSFRKKGLLL